MDDIVRKAIEGGYKGGHIWGYEESLQNKYIIIHGDNGERVETLPINYIVLDPLFWQALGKATRIKCGEHTKKGYCVNCDGKGFHNQIGIWTALKFHEINLTESWSKAIEYLEGIIK